MNIGDGRECVKKKSGRLKMQERRNIKEESRKQWRKKRYTENILRI